MEDDASVRLLLRVTLSTTLYEVIETGSAVEACALVHAELPSLVVLDVGLPDGSGIDVCREIKADEELKQIPVILLTGAATTAALESSVIAKADRFITKPFSPLQLVQVVEELLS